MIQLRLYIFCGTFSFSDTILINQLHVAASYIFLQVLSPIQITIDLVMTIKKTLIKSMVHLQVPREVVPARTSRSAGRSCSEEWWTVAWGTSANKAWYLYTLDNLGITGVKQGAAVNNRVTEQFQSSETIGVLWAVSGLLLRVVVVFLPSGLPYYLRELNSLLVACLVNSTFLMRTYGVALHQQRVTWASGMVISSQGFEVRHVFTGSLSPSDWSQLRIFRITWAKCSFVLALVSLSLLPRATAKTH